MVRWSAWLLPVVVLAGCTGTPVATPEPSVTTDATCVVASVSVGGAMDPELQLTHVVRRIQDLGSVAISEPVDETFTPSLHWATSPAPDDAQVWAAIGEERDSPEDLPSASPQDNKDAVVTMVSSIDSDPGEVIVGYSSVEVAEHPVTVTCGEGGTARGTLTTWSHLESGVVSCAEKPKGAASTTPARKAWEEHCPTG